MCRFSGKQHRISHSRHRQRRSFRKNTRGFEYHFKQYGKLKREEIAALDYNALQTWKRIQRHVISEG